LPDVGWQLGLLAPVDEIASQSQAVTTTIRQDATDTFQSITLVLTALFLVVLLLVAYVNRRLIVQPIEALASGVQAIAGGDLYVQVTPQSEDEIGSLAHSFNEMAGQLAAARDELETRVERRTRELGALYAVTAAASRVVEQNEPLYLPVMAAETEDTPASGNNAGQNSFLGAPLHAKGEVIGVLSIIGRANLPFSPEEVALLGAIADQMGVAVENARLYRQAEALAVVQERQRLARELHDAVT